MPSMSMPPPGLPPHGLPPPPPGMTMPPNLIGSGSFHSMMPPPSIQSSQQHSPQGKSQDGDHSSSDSHSKTNSIVKSASQPIKLMG